MFDELTDENVDATQIKSVVFFNDTGAPLTGKIWLDYLRISSDGSSEFEKSDTSVFLPFTGDRFINDEIEVGWDSNGKAANVQNNGQMNISFNENLTKNGYLTVLVFNNLIDLSDGAGIIKFDMKADDSTNLKLRFEDVNGKRVDLVDFVPAVSENFENYSFRYK